MNIGCILCPSIWLGNISIQFSSFLFYDVQQGLIQARLFLMIYPIQIQYFHSSF
jgi:hypothetical protein